jgi:hypothetical protein
MGNIKETIFTVKEAEQYLKDRKNPYPQTEDYAELFYIDYINNFLTIKQMSEAYYMSRTEATNWIKIGKIINNKKETI